MKSTTRAKPPALGTIWVARATLYDKAGRAIGTCTCAPNAIAQALLEHRQAVSVREDLSRTTKPRAQYADRMAPWNDCPSGYRPARTATTEVR